MLIASGCVQARPCDTTEDCFMGQRCAADGLCQDGSAQTNSSSPPDDSTADNTKAGANDAPGDVSTPGSSGDAPACVMPGLTCAEDDYERFGGWMFEPDSATRRVGCVNLDDEEIVGLDQTIEARLCASDYKGELYYVEYSRCRNIDILVEMTVEIDADECTAEHVDIGWRPNCNDTTMRCLEDHDEANGIWKFSVVIPRVDTPIPSQTVPIDIKAVANGTEFGYKLTTRVTSANN